jgi:hypothetical protein
MRYLITLLAAAPLLGCADLTTLTSPAAQAQDRAAHSAYLELEYLEDLEYYQLECDCTEPLE